MAIDLLFSRLKGEQQNTKPGAEKQKREQNMIIRYSLYLISNIVFGRYYQDIIKQMEVNQPSPAPASPYPRRYLQELPSFRVVHSDSELDDIEDNLSSYQTNSFSLNISSDVHGSLLAPGQRSPGH